METIEDLFQAGFDVKLQKLPKIDVHTGEKYIKFCWDVKLDDFRKRNKWEGFNTSKECIEDMLKEINKHTN